MKNIEELLKKEKALINNLEVPQELEVRLHKALEGKSFTKKFYLRQIVAVAAVFLLLFGYNFDAIAYYSKKILGFDTIISSNLKELNDLGNGQIIDKSYTFQNGAIFTLDGIMTDENQLIVFYSFHNPDNDGRNVELLNIKGLFNTYHMNGGYGINRDGGVIKGVFDFPSPKFYERKLTLCLKFQNQGHYEEGEISFKIDRSKAMGYSIKEKINKTIKVDNYNLRFKSITASPTQTVIEGSIDLKIDRITDRDFNPNIELELLVDGKAVNTQGAGTTSSLKGYTFNYNFDRIPANFSSIEIKVNKMPTSKLVDVKVPINPQEKDHSFEIEKQKVSINEIYFDDNYTYITLTSEDHLYLPELFLITDSKVIPFESTINSQLHKTEAGEIFRERTVRFENQEKEFDLQIKRIDYLKYINELIKVY